MRAKCSMTGERHLQGQTFISIGLQKPVQEKVFGAWNKAHVSNLRTVTPAADLWLSYQAQSLSGRPTTVDEAKELFKFVDVVSREVKP